MLKVEKYVTMSPDQWAIVIEGMRNPLNSWDKSDSYTTNIVDCETMNKMPAEFFLGENDHDLMMSLSEGGGPHSKYRRMMPVWVTVTAPLYWWKEFETYRTGVAPNPIDIEINSCSTMHKIHSNKFVAADFSFEHLSGVNYEGLTYTIDDLNDARERYLKTKDKDYWWQMIQLLPSSYNQKRTIMLNYEALAAMYKWRKDHKLDEWRTFCAWIKELPYSELITLEGNEDE